MATGLIVAGAIAGALVTGIDVAQLRDDWPEVLDQSEATLRA